MTKTKYTHESIENHSEWKDDIEAALGAHPEKLLSLVQENKLAPSAEVKAANMHKQAYGTEMTATDKNKLIEEHQSTAYYIIMETIDNKTFKFEAKRHCSGEKAKNGKALYDFINSQWDVTSDATETKALTKHNEKLEYIAAGCKSMSAKHVGEYVTGLHRFNEELANTKWKMQDPEMVQYVLNAIAKHDIHFPTVFRVANTSKDWDKNFNKVWGNIEAQLVARDATIQNSNRSSAATTDVLTTNTKDAMEESALMKQLAELTKQIAELKSGRGSSQLATGTKQPPPQCADCGQFHWQNKEHGCIGKALSEGTVTLAEAAKVFWKAKHPTAAANNAKKNYEEARRAAQETVKPKKTVQLMVSTATLTYDAIVKSINTHGLANVKRQMELLNKPLPSQGRANTAVLKFDTQAQDTIVSDARFFPDGVDTSITLEITTIVASACNPKTQGMGTAIFVKDGVEYSIKNAHLFEGAKANCIATRHLESSWVDTEHNALKLKDGAIPFDAGYCNLSVRFRQDTSDNNPDVDPDPPRHPAAARAILLFGTKHFGGITGNASSRAGTGGLTTDEMGNLYFSRTNLNPRILKLLPDVTDAPDVLRKLTDLPSNQDAKLVGSMDKVPTKPHTSARDRVLSFDLHGPLPPSRHGDNRYSLGIKAIDGDKITHHTLFFKHKSDFPEVMDDFLNDGDYKGWTPWTDNEIVLNSKDAKAIMRKQGLRNIRNSCEYEPWQNPIERDWRTYAAGHRIAATRAFASADEGDKYWPYSYSHMSIVLTALHCGEKHTRISHLRTLYCLCYAKIPRNLRENKLAAQAEKCMHLGYSRSKEGYILEVLEGPRKGKIITSSQVKFRENIFPMRTVSLEKQADSTTADTTDHDTFRLWDDIDADAPHALRADEDDGDDIGDESGDEGVMDDEVAGDAGEEEDDDREVGEADGDDGADDDEHPRASRSRSRDPLPQTVFAELDKGLRSRTIRVLHTTTSADAPRKFADIAKMSNVDERNKWYKAHYAENDGLFDCPDVLKMVPLPPGLDRHTLMWLNTLYTIKRDGRYKARTVLSWDESKAGWFEAVRTFSPTARATTMRFLCALAAEHGLVIRLADVKQAYTNGEWPATLKKALAHMPSGYQRFIDGVEYGVEVGNLYGHPLAGRNWWKRVLAWLICHGFVQSEHDPCMFTKTDESGADRMILIVYVDDVLTFATPNSNVYAEWEMQFSKDFDWTNHGTDFDDYLSVNITQSPGCITLDMQKYIETMEHEHLPGGIHHPYNSPADTDLVKLVARVAAVRDTKYHNTPVGKRFRTITMQLLYLGLQARPDIMAAVGLLTRVQAWPSPELLKRAERVLIYVIGTKTLKITYTKECAGPVDMLWAPHVAVKGASDASFDVAHSTSGYIFRKCGAAFAWQSKKQTSIALHTQHAEIAAGSDAACEAVAIMGLSESAGYPIVGPIILHMDSSSGIDLAYDPMHYNKSKHIARRDLFIRELVEREVVKPTKVTSAKMVADIMTKPLPNPLFKEHRTTVFGAQE